MTNALFPKALEAFAGAGIDISTATIKWALVSGYTYDSTDEFMSDILSTGTINGTPVALTSKTRTLGVIDAADSTITDATTSATDHCIIVYQSSAVTGGSDVATSAQRAIFYLDTGTNFPIHPGGGNVNAQWDNGANKIGKL